MRFLDLSKRFFRSKRWRGMRADLLRKRGNFCEACGLFSLELELHHILYIHKARWLKFLCKNCHKEITILNCRAAGIHGQLSDELRIRIWSLWYSLKLRERDERKNPADDSGPSSRLDEAIHQGRTADVPLPRVSSIYSVGANGLPRSCEWTTPAFEEIV